MKKIIGILSKLFYFFIVLSFLFPWAYINTCVSAFHTILTANCLLFIWGGPTYCENKTYVYESYGWFYGEWRWNTERYYRFIITPSQFVGIILWISFIYGFKRVISGLKKAKEREEIMREALKAGLKAVLKAETKPEMIGLPSGLAIATSLILGFVTLVIVGVEVNNFRMIAFGIFGAAAAKGEFVAGYFIAWISWILAVLLTFLYIIICHKMNVYKQP